VSALVHSRPNIYNDMKMIFQGHLERALTSPSQARLVNCERSVPNNVRSSIRALAAARASDLQEYCEVRHTSSFWDEGLQVHNVIVDRPLDLEDFTVTSSSYEATEYTKFRSDVAQRAELGFMTSHAWYNESSMLT